MYGHYTRVIFGVLILAAGGPGWAVEFAGGTGEPNDPYLIETAEQLLAADFTVPETYFRLCCDIDLDGQVPPSVFFRAHLDGAGFEIRNAVGAMDRSIFGIVEPEGTITNLTLAQFDLGLAYGPDSDGVGTAGGLASVNSGTISNCGVIGWISTSRVGTVGGVVGINWGSIVNCFFDGWVAAGWTGKGIEDDGIGPFVGGLAGYNGGSISNCLARGFVVGAMGVGGLVGENNGTIDNCYATCTVIGDEGPGGLVSHNWGSLRNCYAIGRVMGQMRGGLVGMAGRYTGSATNCLWDTYLTDCPRSGAGMGFSHLLNPLTFAANGWGGDPNWVVEEISIDFDSHPRLAWEGTTGETVPEYSLPPRWQGSGMPSDPFVISTIDQLRALLGRSIYWDKHFVLANDLDYGLSLGFRPIGVCSGSSFSGTFDGQGHVIRDLRTEETANDEAAVWNFGLFGYVTGEIRNLHLENLHFTGGMNSRRVGLLAGTCEGLIENCSATGFIGVGENSRFIGELIGVDIGQVSDCEATVTIEAGASSADIGGLVGASYPLL